MKMNHSKASPAQQNYGSGERENDSYSRMKHDNLPWKPKAAEHGGATYFSVKSTS